MTEPKASRIQHSCISRGRGALLLAALWLLCAGTSLPAAAQEPDENTKATPAPETTKPAPDETEQELPEGEGSGNVPPPPQGVEVIYVKSQAFEVLEQEATSSVTQFDAEALKAIGAQNIGDLAKMTPNLEIKTAGATAPTFFIRGVGLSDFAANAPGAVAIYQDDVPRNAPAIQLGTLFDVENVAVLRGPQGSGAGRNASAGAIKIYSRKPTGELGADLQTTFGNYGYQDYQGAVETPLLADMLSARLAFRLSERNALASNRCDQVQNNLNLDIPPPDPSLVGRQVPQLQERIDNAPLWNNVSVCGESRFVTFSNNPQGPPDGWDILPGFEALSPIPGSLKSGVNNMGDWAARGTARLQPPGTDLDILLNAHGGRVDQLSTLGQVTGDVGNVFGAAVGNVGGYRDRDVISMQNELEQEMGLAPGTGLSDPQLREKLANELARHLDKHPFRGDYNRVGDTTLDTYGGFLDGTWDLGSYQVRSITGTDVYNRFRDTDQDFSPEILFEAVINDDAWQATQDLSANGEIPDTNIRWNTGGFYLHEHLSALQDQFARNAGSTNSPQELILDYKQELTSWGAYAGFGWDFLNDFTLEGGARWNSESKHFDYSLKAFGVDSLLRDRSTWDSPTGTISLTYRFRDDTSAYWKYSRGWKGGHYNALPQTTLGATVANPEKIDAFETGVKGSWLDGRLDMTGDLFYYSYTDYQVLVVQDSAVGPPGIAIINANDAEIYGAELEARAEPLDALVLTARFGWLESQFLDFTNSVVRFVVGSDGNAVPRQITVDYTGNQLINSPRFKASGAIDYTFDMGRYGALLPHYDFAWTDDIFFDPTEGRGSPNFQNQLFLPDYAIGQKAYWLHNIRMGYRTADGKIELAGWVRNLTNYTYKSYGFDASTFGKAVVNYVGDPRMYGVDFIVHF